MYIVLANLQLSDYDIGNISKDCAYKWGLLYYNTYDMCLMLSSIFLHGLVLPVQNILVVIMQYSSDFVDMRQN